MSNLTGVLRGGWHPKGKDGGKESWRGDFHGVNQVAGWIGKGKNPNGRSGSSGAPDHISRPLATLKDPAAFGPPPKNVNFHGGAALPNQITPDRRGLGAPLSNSVVESAKIAMGGSEEADIEQREKPSGPPLPYRANRTGLKTDHLPPPPVHRELEGDDASAQVTGVAPGPARPKPSLPPRLPARSNSSNLTSPAASSPPPPTYESVVDERKPGANTYINQEAVSRLGRAGISVPGLGIGQSVKASPTERAQSATSPNPKLNELQSRFSRMNTVSSPSQSPTSPLPPPTQGTTLAQKQSAFATAQSFNKDPSSVSLTDAKSAATTANNFRERHQDQISAGARKANSWNKKYNITERMNSFIEQQAAPAPQQPTGAQHPSTIPTHPVPMMTPDLGNRKPPPPPPPPKKPTAMMHPQTTTIGTAHVPPPVPLGTKPSFG